MPSQINKSTIKAYETDASGINGNLLDVFFPSTIAEVCNIVRANKRVVVRGGGTGLVGGCVPLQGQDVVLDLSKLNFLGEFDKERKTIEVGAGVILDDLQDYLDEFGLEFPVNPSSHSVCTIGGMISTDAVGSRAGLYGKTSKWIKWIEVVDDKGNVFRKGATELSDYVGMEGITGVIVKACLKLSDKKQRTATLFSSESLEEVVGVARSLKRNSYVSMIEFLDKNISLWVGLEEKYHLIIEYESDDGEFKEKEYEKLIKTRDDVYPILAQKGFCRIEDPQVLLDKIEKIMPFFEESKIPVFGHLSVGILHPCFTKEQEKKGLVDDMMKIVKRLSGKVSGEHGIGLLKKEFVEANDKKILINVKKRTDSENKFNVGKVI